VGLAAAAFFLFANEGFRDLIVRTRENGRLERLLARLRSEHTALSDEWTRVQKDPSYTEYLIRRNLGFVKKGEVEYRILVSSHT
jgi:cell division protein FtsB